VFRIQGLKKMN